MNIMKKQIKKIFSNRPFDDGYCLSGYNGEGEYVEWYKNGLLKIHCFFKDNEFNGDFKCWFENGKIEKHSFYKNGELDGEYKKRWNNDQLYLHNFYKNGKLVEMPKNIKEGYIFVDGKYYPDDGDIQ